MATVNIVLTTSKTRVTSGSNSVPIPASVAKAGENITSSASSQQSTITGAAAGKDMWVITVISGNVYLDFGSNPTAAAGDKYLVVANQTREFGVSVNGEKVAIIDA